MQTVLGLGVEGVVFRLPAEERVVIVLKVKNVYGAGAEEVLCVGSVAIHCSIASTTKRIPAGEENCPRSLKLPYMLPSDTTNVISVVNMCILFRILKLCIKIPQEGQ
jgi:hypothetical protein